MAYGFRMLVDMAERSIAESPFVDPTTAVQAIDRLHDCLRQLVGRPLPSGEHRDRDGVVRLTVKVLGWDDYVHLAFDEIIAAGHRSSPVRARVRDALDDLASAAPADRAAVLMAVRRRLDDPAPDRVISLTSAR
jgi:uncharacterized membrane protein